MNTKNARQSNKIVQNLTRKSEDKKLGPSGNIDSEENGDHPIWKNDKENLDSIIDNKEEEDSKLQFTND